MESGLPPLAIACITGSGGTIGDALASDPRIRKISFTGSRDVGEHITKKAGIKRVTMELGSNSPLIVMADADLNKAADAIVATGFANAGQVCISAQRVLAVSKVYKDLVEVLRPKVEAVRTGNQLDSQTKMGPMIRKSDAERVEQWVGEAVASGARVVTGGGRKGAMHEPTLVADVMPSMRISSDELFGPAVAVTAVADIDQAIASGERHALRPECRYLHRESEQRPAVCPRSGQRQHPHQLGPAMARRPDALRRPERQRHRQRGPQIRHPGNDRVKDGRGAWAEIGFERPVHECSTTIARDLIVEAFSLAMANECERLESDGNASADKRVSPRPLAGEG